MSRVQNVGGCTRGLGEMQIVEGGVSASYKLGKLLPHSITWGKLYYHISQGFT